MKYTRKAIIQKLTDAKAFAAETSQEEKITILNEGLEAAILSGRWNGTQPEIVTSVTSSGLLTLGREFLTLKGVRVDDNVRELASPWYNYLVGTNDISQFNTRVQDQGDGFCVFKQPRVPAQLRVECDDEDGVVEIHGTDASDVDIYTDSGIQHGIRLVFNDAKTGSYFQQITGVIKPDTDHVMKLYACYNTGPDEVIGIYAPGELVPSYRRYLIPEAVNATDTDSMVRALVQLRHVDLTNDNDICPISNFQALKKLALYVHWENEGDETRSNSYFEGAIKSLNNELKLMRPPSEVAAVRVNARGGIGSNLFSTR
jgi:hypothetical protein